MEIERSPIFYFNFIKYIITLGQYKGILRRYTLIINEEIQSNIVIVIDENGNKLGQMLRDTAISQANSKGFDLMCVNPNSTPPICKFINYGKYKYEQEKRKKEAKKKQVTIETKEVQLTLRIAEHDMKTKAKLIQKWLEKSPQTRIKVVLAFKGRELSYLNSGMELINNFAKMCDDFASIETNPKFEGKSITMYLGRKQNA